MDNKKLAAYLRNEGNFQDYDPLEFTSSNEQYSQDLLNKTAQQYPFIAHHQPIVTVGKGQGYAETWPRQEEGAPDSEGRPTRPISMPLNRTGVEVYRKESFGPNDLAGEILHVDPYANQVRDELQKSLGFKQWNTLMNNAADYQASLDYGQSEKKAKQNAADSAMRGYVVNQWPERINQEMNYSGSQKRLLDSLRNYMTTGKSK
jgi:hypothetical protein